ncbi:MAG: hypothetical protein AAFO04_19950 [Cyanobacteria bacterium J06592_8]
MSDFSPSKETLGQGNVQETSPLREAFSISVVPIIGLFCWTFHGTLLKLYKPSITLYQNFK